MSPAGARNLDGVSIEPDTPPSPDIPVGNVRNCCRLIMSMGNYMRLGTVQSGTMAASEHTVGIDHPTVRPTNFDPEEDRPVESEEGSSEQ